MNTPWIVQAAGRASISSRSSNYDCLSVTVGGAGLPLITSMASPRMWIDMFLAAVDGFSGWSVHAGHLSMSQHHAADL